MYVLPSYPISHGVSDQYYPFPVIIFLPETGCAGCLLVDRDALIRHFGTYSLSRQYDLIFEVPGSFIASEDVVLFPWAEFTRAARDGNVSLAGALLKTPELPDHRTRCWAGTVLFMKNPGRTRGSSKVGAFLFHPPHLIIYLQKIRSLNRGAIMATIHVLDNEISLYTRNNEDYICITDIARYKDPDRTDYLIQNWLRNRNTIEFLGIWERLNNPDFNPIEFDGFRNQAGLHSFTLTPKQWIEKTSAIGLISKPGRYGGTYAHKDIAYEFASWISVEFKLYLIKEFQRLKDEEHKQLGWDIRRNLAKINYRIHTNAVKGLKMGVFPGGEGPDSGC
jgi:hypothetical protein